VEMVHLLFWGLTTSFFVEHSIYLALAHSSMELSHMLINNIWIACILLLCASTILFSFPYVFDLKSNLQKNANYLAYLAFKFDGSKKTSHCCDFFST
jgi:hypothetical protein